MPTTRNEMQRFTEHWQRFLTRFGKKDEGAPTILHTLLAAYGGEDRHYHGLWHISDGLDLLEEARRDVPEAFENPLNDAAVELGFIDHDVIYDPARLDNESLSARLVGVHAKQLGFQLAVGILAEEAIIATEHKRRAVFTVAKIVCDIDLATLAAPWERFCENSLQVREEYRQKVPSDADFAAGRKAFFATMLDTDVRPTIYQIEYFRTRFERAARANLERVIDTT